MFEDEYQLEFFKRIGYIRKLCPVCGKPYWSADAPNCGEAPCVEYGFIGNSPMKRKMALRDMREDILSFFERNGHTRIGRYPIVARWRNDVFFTQASIYDFQPRVTAGEDDPPANPLIISQTCVRFNDIDNVGRTGRHLTMFEMIGHHVFNSPQKFVYWKEEAVAYCNEYIVKQAGVPQELVVYKEKPWFGGGNAGPSVEVIVQGLELATLVFMNLKANETGDILLEDGTRYSRMAMRVVDPGWGLDRFTWMSQGASSAYEAIFGDVLRKLKSEIKIAPDDKILSEFSRVAGMMNVETSSDVRELRSRVAERLRVPLQKLEDEIIPMENLYAICDHTRALMFIINDGVVPSNVKEGYYARLLVRRALPAMAALGLNLRLADIVGMQIDYFGVDFPELLQNRDDILKIVEWEENAYGAILRDGKAIIGRIDTRLKDEGKTWGFEELREMYDSHGLRPDLVRQFASVPVSVPEDFDQRLAKYHEERDRKAAKEEKIDALALPDGLPATELDFYKNDHALEFEASVVHTGAHAGEHFVVLDKTLFYPEGGGEESDTGSISGIPVKHAAKIGNVVVHYLASGSHRFAQGQKVRCEVDGNRRAQLTSHHTATHILNGVTRELLGNHVWQAGAHKAADGARLDITHYTGLSKEEVAEIEKRSNEIVAKNLKVTKSFIPRAIAERQYGFRLYQGGAVPGKLIRVVDISGWDIEACGGTHADTTGEVGRIIITGTKRIQQGIVRLEFVSGKAAEDCIAKESAARKTAPTQEKKAAPKLSAAQVESKAMALLEAAYAAGSARIVSGIIDNEPGNVTSVVRAVTAKGNVVSIIGFVCGGKATIVIARSNEPNMQRIDCAAVLKNALPSIGGTGGGRPDYAQGGGSDAGALGAAIKAAADEIAQSLKSA